MTAKSDCECKYVLRINTLYGLLALLLTVAIVTCGFAGKTFTNNNDIKHSVASNTKALVKLDGNDRRIAEIQRDIAWIVMIMKEDREERKENRH